MLKFAANIDQSWIDFPIVDRLSRSLKRPVSIINDADAAGIAEMRFGIGVGEPGVVLFLTLGTGVGSAVFNDGLLVPNTEFGQMEIRGRPAERRSAAVARVKRGLSWKAWAKDLDEHLDAIHRLDWPNLIILGGGVSKSAEKFVPPSMSAARWCRRAPQRRGHHRRGDARPRGSPSDRPMPAPDAPQPQVPTRRRHIQSSPRPQIADRRRPRATSG